MGTEHYVVRVDAQFLHRVVRGVEGLLEVRVAERVRVADYDAAFLQVSQIGLQGRRIHGYQHVGLVARGVYPLAYVHLEA